MSFIWESVERKPKGAPDKEDKEEGRERGEGEEQVVDVHVSTKKKSGRGRTSRPGRAKRGEPLTGVQLRQVRGGSSLVIKTYTGQSLLSPCHKLVKKQDAKKDERHTFYQVFSLQFILCFCYILGRHCLLLRFFLRFTFVNTRKNTALDYSRRYIKCNVRDPIWMRCYIY